MDFSDKSVTSHIKTKSGVYEIPAVMTYGIPSTLSKLETVHPLEKSERNYEADQERVDMQVLRSTQGLHAPLRLQMERKAAKLAGGRLPFMPSERLGSDVLLGKDTTLDFSDVLNTPDLRERMGIPSAEMDRVAGLL